MAEGQIMSFCVSCVRRWEKQFALEQSIRLCSRIVGFDLVPKQKAGMSGEEEMCVCV